MENKKKKKYKEKEEGKKDGKTFLSEVVCPVCGRRFFPSPLWAWKVGDKKYCRYSCMRVVEKKKYEKKKRKIVAELKL